VGNVYVYDNWLADGKTEADYDEPEPNEALRFRYIESNPRLRMTAEQEGVEVSDMPTELIWALGSKWMCDDGVGWKRRDMHSQKLFKFWRSGSAERLIAGHLKFTMPDALIEVSRKFYAPSPMAHRKFMDPYDLKVTLNGETKYYEIKHGNYSGDWTSAVNITTNCPDPDCLWVAKAEQVNDKVSTTTAWTWLNRNLTHYRAIDASTFSQWKCEKHVYWPGEYWYCAPKKLWRFNIIRRKP
jgi:hypothetical protein